MRAFLDNTEIPQEHPSQRAAFAAAIAAAEGRGRIVIEAVRDGSAVRPDDLAELPDGPGEAQEIRFISADPGQLVSVTLGEVADAMGELVAAQTALAEQIQAGEMDELGDRLTEIVEIWQAVRQSVDHATHLLGPHVQQTRVDVGGRAMSVADAAPALAAALGEVQRTVREQDWSGLADVLLEDLSDQATLWRGLIGGLVTTTRGAPPG